jgi:hypothetical protein
MVNSSSIRLVLKKPWKLSNFPIECLSKRPCSQNLKTSTIPMMSKRTIVFVQRRYNHNVKCIFQC